MPRKVACNLAAAHRKADQNDVVELKFFEHRRKIVSKDIVIVALRRVRRLPEAAAVIGDHPIACLKQSHRLKLEHVAGQRPAVNEDHSSAMSDVLDVKIGLIGSLNEWHRGLLFSTP